MKIEFELTPELAEKLQIDKKWTGKYEIRQLNAKEYLQIGEKCLQKVRMELIKQGRDNEPPVIPPFMFNFEVVLASVRFKGKRLPENIPSKLYEILSSYAIPLNLLTPQERELYFLRDSTTKSQGQDIS